MAAVDTAWRGRLPRLGPLLDELSAGLVEAIIPYLDGGFPDGS